VPHPVPIRLEGVSKCYRIWNSPAARLHGPMAGGFARLPGLPEPWRAAARRRAADSFREFYALTDVSLEVRAGECVGVIGMNGSGKSTLLQLVAGTLTPTNGSIVRSGLTAALLELGSGFNPEFTGAENVYLNASILGLTQSQIAARFDAIAAFAEIGDFMEQPVKTYSSGMVVRLAFAVLTQVEPQILIIDEALAVGDAYFQHKSISHIRSFRDAGGSLLFVSHDAHAVKSLCDRAILLDRGQVVHQGAPDAVLDFYNAMIAKREKDHEIRQSTNEAGQASTRSGNRQATLVEVDLLDESGASVRAVSIGESVVFRCVVQCAADVENPAIGILIRDRLGNDIFGTNTEILQIAPPRWIAGERWEAQFEVGLQLGPGSYSLTVAAHSAITHVESNYDWIDRALVFEVIADARKRFAGCACLPVRGTMRESSAAGRALLDPAANP